MFGWFKKKSLNAHIHAKMKVRIKGVEFIIRKVDVLNYLEGARVLRQSYDTYQAGGAKDDVQLSHKKIREHLADVIIAGVVSPKIGRKEGEGLVPISDVFIDMEMANALYDKIVEFSYGKKKLKSLGSHERS